MGFNLDKEVYIKGTLNLGALNISFANTPVVKRSLKKMANDDLLLEVRVRPLRYKRSDAQNRYYWGICVTTIMGFLKESWGVRMSREDVHQMNYKYTIGDMFEKRTIKDPRDGNILEVYVEVKKRTSKMNTLEFTNFIEELRAYWLHAGCDIPEPEDKENNFLEDIQAGYDQLTDT